MRLRMKSVSNTIPLRFILSIFRYKTNVCVVCESITHNSRSSTILTRLILFNRVIQCFQITFISVCSMHFYLYDNTTCESRCNCLEGPCHAATGLCPNSLCQIGWTGPKCNEERTEENLKGLCKVISLSYMS